MIVLEIAGKSHFCPPKAAMLNWFSQSSSLSPGSSPSPHLDLPTGQWPYQQLVSKEDITAAPPHTPTNPHILQGCQILVQAWLPQHIDNTRHHIIITNLWCRLLLLGCLRCLLLYLFVPWFLGAETHYLYQRFIDLFLRGIHKSIY